ncbi:hypothetical protein PUND_a3426 [Pseudoalteromonas undina]|uniref:Uncharacterized protein n=1 Tax=Pseudoalteromonas undina TaxID=43660 RepID=A0ABN0NLR7_9GAMM|nr:hypothetical protein [Pseudoalteromonas undina]KAF7767444.1 hypothetical protein PUND_a3426 [Pseudoalteromonas undina]
MASNPKLFTIGVGKLKAAKAMKTGFVVSLIISVTFHAIDQVLNDQKTWYDLVAGVAGVAVVGVAIGISSGVIALGGSLITGSAIAPLIIIVAVGFLFAWVFRDTTVYVDYLTQHLHICEENIQAGKVRIRNQIQKLEKDYKDSPVDFIKGIFGVPILNFTKTYK